MKSVMAFAGRTRALLGSSSGKTMGNMSRGLSALGSIAEYAGQRQQAAAMDQEARDERMAGRQEYVTAAEQVTAIDDEYNRLVGSQLTAAATMGIDAGSGSVIAARAAAQDDADRERRIIRNSAEANARVRFARATNLREAAKTTRFGATLKLGLDLASTFAGGR